jgi:8-oxo-dGTP pyrophosphatase MutT (NUDIX family)
MASANDHLREDLGQVLLTTEDALTLDVRGKTDAAVLVPLYLERGRLHTVFTKRHDDLRRHPGEISFPGGRYDEGERDLRATALREAEEEIGLPVQAVELAGRLPARERARSPGVIVPVVGFVADLPPLVPSPAEVEAILPAPISSLLADGAYWEELWSPDGSPSFALPFFADRAVLSDDLVWGATAHILTDLLRAVTASAG